MSTHHNLIYRGGWTLILNEKFSQKIDPRWVIINNATYVLESNCLNLTSASLDNSGIYIQFENLDINKTYILSFEFTSIYDINSYFLLFFNDININNYGSSHIGIYQYSIKPNSNSTIKLVFAPGNADFVSMKIKNVSLKYK